MASSYHTGQQLQALGERIRDKAIQVSVEHESAKVVDQIHADHAHDPLLDSSGQVKDNPPINPDVIRAYATNEYAAIPQHFSAFATADPAAMQPTIDTLWRVAYALHPDVLSVVMRGPLDNPIPAHAWHPYTSIGTRIEDIYGSRLREWEGSAADAFRDNYLSPLKATVPKQAALAAALAVALTAHKKVREEQHKNIWDVGQKTLKVLDTLHACRPQDATVALTVFTAAVSVLLAIPTDGLSFAAVYGLGTAGLGFAKAAGDVKKTIGGKTVRAVISDMLAVITTLTQGIDQQEQEISRFLSTLGTQLTETAINPPRPDAMIDLGHADVETLRKQLYVR